MNFRKPRMSARGALRERGNGESGNDDSKHTGKHLDSARSHAFTVGRMQNCVTGRTRQSTCQSRQTVDRSDQAGLCKLCKLSSGPVSSLEIRWKVASACPTPAGSTKSRRLNTPELARGMGDRFCQRFGSGTGGKALRLTPTPGRETGAGLQQVLMIDQQIHQCYLRVAL